jgi:uncharacterized protein YbjT (DUF2867 family)
MIVPARVIQPFPPGMATPWPPLVEADRAALIARIEKLPPHSRRRLELEARLRDLTSRRLEAEIRGRS